MDDKLRQLIMQGRELYASHEYQKAEDILERVVKENCSFADVHNMLGVIYHEFGRLTEARSAFEKAVTINPQYTEAQLNLAVTLNEQGAYREAKEIYSRAMALSHSQPRSLDPFARGKIANMHADLGDAYQGIGFYAESVREYNTALELCPTFIDIRLKLANTYRDMGEFKAAINEYREVIAINPNFVPGRLNLGVAYYMHGEKELGREQWEKVLTIEAENKSAKLYLKFLTEEKK